MPKLSSSLSSMISSNGQIMLPPTQPAPVRYHYKTPEELQQIAASVARGDAVALPGYEQFAFDKRLSENAKFILHAYRSSDAASRAGETITPAAQWLLDNHYLIDKNSQQVRRDLPPRFMRQLP